MIQNLRARSVHELDKNLCSWAQNSGCLCVPGELYMATGFLDRYSSDLSPCGMYVTFATVVGTNIFWLSITR